MAEVPDRIVIHNPVDGAMRTMHTERITDPLLGDVEYRRVTPPTANDEQRARKLAEQILDSVGGGDWKAECYRDAAKQIAAALTQSRADAIAKIEEYGRRCFVMSQEMSLSESDRKDFESREAAGKDSVHAHD
jgi:hypothetical protein